MNRNHFVSDEIRLALEGWEQVGLPPSPFLHAVLSNDLRRALTVSTPEMRKELPEIVKYIWDTVDAKAHGSLAAVQAWAIFKIDAARGKATPLEMCRQKVGDYSLLESKAWQESLALLVELCEFWCKDKQDCEVGIIRQLIAKGRYCLAGQHVESLNIQITKEGEG